MTQSLQGPLGCGYRRHQRASARASPGSLPGPVPRSRSSCRDTAAMPRRRPARLGTVHRACRRRHIMASMEDAMAEVAARQGGIDVLCANAGIFPAGKTRGDDRSTVGRGRTTPISRAPFFRSRRRCPISRNPIRAASSLRRRSPGPITGYPGWTHYGATKAGQLGFMRTACIELGQIRHHRQCRDARQHHDRGPGRHGRGLYPVHGQPRCP